MSTLIDFMPNPDKLRSVLESGRVVIADFTDAIYLFVDVKPEDVQVIGTVPYAMFTADQNGYNLAKLVAAIILEVCPTGAFVVPNPFDGDEEWGIPVVDEPGADGNRGTIDDNKHIRLVGEDGHYLTKE